MTPEPQTASPLCRALLCLLDYEKAHPRNDWFEGNVAGAFRYTPTGLLAALWGEGGAATRETSFPNDPVHLGRQLNAQRKHLKRHGVIVSSFRHHRFGRVCILTYESDGLGSASALRGRFRARWNRRLKAHRKFYRY